MRATHLPTFVLTLLATAAHGQGAVPLGDQFQINTYTTEAQERPAVAALADGGFVTIWHSHGSSDPDTPWFSIRGRLHGPGGAPVGEDFQINTYTGNIQWSATVTGLTGGDFVAVWHGDAPGTSDSSGIQGRRFAADGTPVTGEFQVNTFTPNTQWRPAVTALADGGFVAVWDSIGSSGSDRSSLSIQGRLYSPDGTPVAGDFQVNTYTTDRQERPSVAALADGGFQVVWTSWGSSGSDTSQESIQGRRYAADGTARGDQFQVNAFTTDSQIGPAVAGLADGGSVMIWSSFRFSGPGPYSTSVQGRRFLADGTAGGEFQVNSYTAGLHDFPAVTASADGGFVTAWRSSLDVGLTHDLETIRGQRFEAGGEPLGGEFQISSSTAVGQLAPSAATQADGSLVVAWQSADSSGSDSDWYGIQGRRYAAPRFALAGLGGKCLDVEGGRSPESRGGDNPAGGTPVNLYSCHGGDNQRWHLELTPFPQQISGLGGKCLVPGPVDASGDIRAVIGTCDGPETLWQLGTPTHAEASVLIHAETSLCLDVEGAVDDDGTPIILFDCHGGANQLWRPTAEICTPDTLGLCLEQERFRAELTWRSFDGTTGAARAAPVGSDDSGLLWFFEADNWEMLIKVLDGCDINDRFWVFAAATTTVEYTLRVTDTALGTVREYSNPIGAAAAAITDTDAFATCAVTAGSAGASDRQHSPAAKANRVNEAKLRLKGACVPSLTRMCLSDQRFSVEVEWIDYAGNAGDGQVVDTGPLGANDTSGLLWFFNSSNWEMLVKVLDACEVNGRFWMLAAATTDVAYTLGVTDTETGVSREYSNPLGNAAEALVDTFETCP